MAAHGTMVTPNRKSAGLAILGGQPAFQTQLHVGSPNLPDRDRFLTRVNEMWDRRWLTNNGPLVREFERKICEMVQVENCVATCNATIALEIAVRALGLKGEVIVPSFTFIATAHCLKWQEVMPVYCDVDPESHHLDPAQVEHCISTNTSGILGVHTWGKACGIKELEEIARRRGLHLLFDAAHAFGCTYRGVPVGGFGDLEVFSFHATKFLNTFEGGAITTNNSALADKARLMRNFGFVGIDRVDHIGTNGKMPEISAAMGLASLESIQQFVAANYKNYTVYAQELDGLPGLKMHRYDQNERSNYQYIVLEVDAEQAGLTRDELVEVLWLENVRARRYFYPGCHAMEPYASLWPRWAELLPQTRNVCERVLVLPNGTAVSPKHVRRVCALVKTALQQSRLVRDAIVRRRNAGVPLPWQE